MKLTDSQKHTLLEALKSRMNAPQKCSVCAQGTWLISDTVFELREFQRGDLVLGGALYPVIPMTCSHCSATVLLNPIHLGVPIEAESFVSVEQAKP